MFLTYFCFGLLTIKMILKGLYFARFHKKNYICNPF